MHVAASFACSALDRRLTLVIGSLDRLLEFVHDGHPCTAPYLFMIQYNMLESIS